MTLRYGVRHPSVRSERSYNPAMSHIRSALRCTTWAALCVLGAARASAAPGPTLRVDAAADRHPISPYIYGMASPDPALAREIGLPMERWGGDATTRYNWRLDRTNAGDDWFFMAGGDGPSVPSGGPDRMVDAARSFGGRALVTVPIIDLIDSATETNCSYPVSLFGRQQKVNPYVHPTVNGHRTDAGNGRTPDGKPIVLTREQELRVNVANTPQFQQEWVRHLVARFGPASAGGVAAYELDNEPGGWNNTHRDVHPGLTGHDELVSRSLAYAGAIKSVDPSARVIGPGDFMMHYQSDGKPGDGAKEHGGLGQGDYYLRSFHEYDRAHGHRLLDDYDQHYYPFAQDGQTADTVIEQTRSLWDPTYVERNWYGKWHGAKAVLPGLHRSGDREYPGTAISISEWGWGDAKQLDDAVAEADVLGIFGRERVDLACRWGPPKAVDAAANAFRIYRNYDGHGGRYGDTWVRSSSSHQAIVSIYAAVRSADGALTVVEINKTNGPLSVRTDLTGFRPAAAAAVFRFDGGNPRAIVPQPEQLVGPGGFDAALPAKSVTMFVVRAG
jgi:hypothetical protein